MTRLGAVIMISTAVMVVPSSVGPASEAPTSMPSRAPTTIVTDRAAPMERATCWSAPVDAAVADPFRAPGCRWCPGNRGIEYATSAGDAVRSVASGRVAFDGPVAGRRYLSIDLAVSGGLLRVTYGGLDPTAEHFAVGQTIERDQILGSATGPVHLGVRWNGEYVDPAAFIDAPARRARLVPVEGTPGRAADGRAACR